MRHQEVARYWNANARTWIKLASEGHDIFRDRLNTPAFLEMLPDIEGLTGLDIGCGDGHNTRLLAKRGARMVAVDIAEEFVKHARRIEEKEPLGIDYRVASAVDLPFPDAAFDFATAFMSFMDIAETDEVIREAHRVLKPGGFLQFSITHPCFDTPHRRKVRDERGETHAVEVGDYFRNLDGVVLEWLFGAAPPEAKEGLEKFKIPRFTRTVSQWLNSVIDAGFVLERLAEPRPTDEALRACPRIRDARIVAYYLHVRARKPG